MEAAFVIDGLPYIRPKDTEVVEFKNVPFPDGSHLSSLNGARICEDNVYWTNLTIDPFVGVFTVHSNSPTKGTAAYVIVLPVVFGVVILLVAAVIIAAIISPKVRSFFRPFSNRGKAHKDFGNLDSGSNDRSSASNTGWTKSARPSNVE